MFKKNDIIFIKAIIKDIEEITNEKWVRIEIKPNDQSWSSMGFRLSELESLLKKNS